MASFKVKELKKGGKPAQVPARHMVLIEENKAFLKDLFSKEPAGLVGFRLTEVNVEPEKSIASAGNIRYGGSRVVNSYVSFGTSTDFLCRVQGVQQESPVVIPERFLNQKKTGIHPELFKVGDILFLESHSSVKNVNIGKSGMIEGVRVSSQVCGWLPAEKEARAVKEGRVIVTPVYDVSKFMRVEPVAPAFIPPMDVALAAGGSSSEEEVGNWWE